MTPGSFVSPAKTAAIEARRRSSGATTAAFKPRSRPSAPARARAVLDPREEAHLETSSWITPRRDVRVSNSSFSALVATTGAVVTAPYPYASKDEVILLTWKQKLGLFPCALAECGLHQRRCRELCTNC